MFLTESTPSNISSLDLAYKRGDPATIIVSQKFTAAKQPFFLGITQTFQHKVSLLEKRGSFYFVILTGPLLVDFHQITHTVNETWQQPGATSDQVGSTDITVFKADYLNSSERIY